MPDDFTHDTLLSHSSKDKAVVRAVAERLRADGLRVWLDVWEMQFLRSLRLRAFALNPSGKLREKSC
jgi:hypothetical protein